MWIFTGMIDCFLKQKTSVMKLHTFLTPKIRSFKKIIGLVTMMLMVSQIFGLDMPSSTVSVNQNNSIVASVNASAAYSNDFSTPGIPAPDPIDATVCVGGTANFTVSGYSTYQWQESL